MALGMVGHGACCSATTSAIQRTPIGALLILGAAIAWAFGTVLLRKWKLPLPQNTLSGWMMLLGLGAARAARAVLRSGAARRRAVRRAPGSRSLYNIFLAGTLAHWAWFTLARTLPVAVSSMSSLPVPIVGVFSGMLVLGERPGPSEWTALALVVAAMVAVLWPPRRPLRDAPAAPDD